MRQGNRENGLYFPSAYALFIINTNYLWKVIPLDFVFSLLFFLAPAAVFAEGATTTTIKVAAKPPKKPGDIRRYNLAIGSKKCDALAGPASPSCTLTGLAAGTQYNASAFSRGDDSKTSRKTFGAVSTLPDGRVFSIAK